MEVSMLEASQGYTVIGNRGREEGEGTGQSEKLSYDAISMAASAREFRH